MGELDVYKIRIPLNAGQSRSCQSESKQMKRLTCEEFQKSFHPNHAGFIEPSAAQVNCHSSPGAVLRPKQSEESGAI